MTRRWLLLGLSLGLGALSGCATAGSDVTHFIPSLNQNETQSTSITTSPYAPVPVGPQPRPIDPVPQPPPPPEVRTTNPSANQSPAPPVPPDPPVPIVAPAPPPSIVVPAARPPLDPPVVQALAKACKLEQAGQHAEALQALRDAGVNELVARMLLTSAVRGGASADMASGDGMLREVKKLEQELQAQAPLTLTKACFCKRIQGFGLYDPLPDRDPSFLGGTDGRPGERVLLYIEVGNFQTAHTPLADGSALHETLLTGLLQIRPSGLAAGPAPIAAKIPIPREVRPSRSPREDYFMRLEFNVPPGLAPGTYTLEIKLEDETPPLVRPEKTRQASRMLEFRVVEAR